MDNTETCRADVGDTEERVEGSSPKVSQPEAVQSMQDLKEKVGNYRPGTKLATKRFCSYGAHSPRR